MTVITSSKNLWVPDQPQGVQNICTAIFQKWCWPWLVPSHLHVVRLARHGSARIDSKHTRRSRAVCIAQHEDNWGRVRVLANIRENVITCFTLCLIFAIFFIFSTALCSTQDSLQSFSHSLVLRSHSPSALRLLGDSWLRLDGHVQEWLGQSRRNEHRRIQDKVGWRGLGDERSHFGIWDGNRST